MTQRSMFGWSLGIVLLLTLPAWAVEYRLQVANLDYLTVSAHTDPRPGHPGEGSLHRLEARLDSREFSASAVIPGREVELVEDPIYGGAIPRRLSILPTTREQAWTTLIWEANPGETMAFVVKSDMAGWQEAWFVGANPEGTLRRLSHGGPSWFGGRSYEVPQVAYDFLANALDRGIFPSWMAENARSLNGMSIAVGRGRDRIYRPDRVYVVLNLPAEPRTFKVVIGWRDHSDRQDDDSKGIRTN